MKEKIKKTISIKSAIGIIIFTNALTLETVAISYFGNIYNIYTVIPLLLVFGSIIFISEST